MKLPFENAERRKKRDPEILVWDRWIRVGHWLMAFAFAALYLEYRKFPLHAYAGYLVFLVVVLRVVKGFAGSGAARFSAFWYSPREMFDYFRKALRGEAGYHFSHNPMGAAMVYALLALLLAGTATGLMLYSAGQQLGPLGALVPDAWEDNLIAIHHRFGHLTAILVCLHMLGVLWAAWLHRENYVMAMLNGIRRIPRAEPLPPGVEVVVKPSAARGVVQRLVAKLTYRYPLLGSVLLMGIIVFVVTLPLIDFLVRINKVLPSY